MVEEPDERLVLRPQQIGDEMFDGLPASVIFWPRMLSLTSSSTPRLTATRSLVKVVTRCGIAVFEHVEVVLRETGDEAAVGVDHRDRDRNGQDVGAEHLRHGPRGGHREQQHTGDGEATPVAHGAILGYASVPPRG